MYIDELELENFRCFSKQKVQFMHPDSPRAAGARFPNVNVILGANGVGKTTLLKAAALITHNSLIRQSGFRPYNLVRVSRENTKNKANENTLGLTQLCEKQQDLSHNSSCQESLHAPTIVSSSFRVKRITH